MIRQLRYVFFSIRPTACLGAGLLAAASHRPFIEFDTLTIFLSVFCGASGCFLINDLADRKKDLLNGKKRPIATGVLPKSVAITAATCFALIFLAFSISLGSFHTSLFLVTLAIFLGYPTINNRTGLISNIIVAITVGLSILYGSGSIVLPVDLWLLVATVILVIAAREILLDGLDMKGDHAIGKPSIPLSFGKKGSVLMVMGLYSLGSVLLLFIMSINANITMDVILLLALFALWLPFIISLITKRKDWMLFNVRSSHLFLLLMIMALLIQ